MAFGFGFGMPRIFAVPPFSPASLFVGGIPGVWYDPSDYGATGTLFQDSAGTTPVTAVEQPVGLMLDKSQGLVLGPEQYVTGSGAWTRGFFSVNGTISAAGTAITITQGSSDSAGFRWVQPVICVVGRSYRLYAGSITLSGGTGATIGFTSSNVGTGLTVGNSTTNLQAPLGRYITATATTMYVVISLNGGTTGATATFDNISVKELPGNHAFQSTSASRPVLSARVNKLLATATLATQSVTTRAAAHTLRFEGAGSITLSGTATGTFAAGSHSVTATAGTLTLTVSGSVTSADLRETNDGVGVPTYQAVVTSTNYATTGFLPYLRFDGVDDSLSTNSISFTSTDKMSVFAGVRKLSDAARGILAELSPDALTNNGSFLLGAPYNTGSNEFKFYCGGTTRTGVDYLSPGTPTTRVLTGLNNIATPVVTIRADGVQAATSSSSQGTGNYGNYPLYIGRRANAGLPFNGQLYSMVIVGKAVNSVELAVTETYVNQQTGAY